MSKKTIEQLIFLPFNLINLARLTLVEKLFNFVNTFKMPSKYIKLFHKV